VGYDAATAGRKFRETIHTAAQRIEQAIDVAEPTGTSDVLEQRA
jgi:hypothetical protein